MRAELRHLNLSPTSVMVVTISVSASVSALLLLTCLLSLLVLLTSRRKRVVPHFPLSVAPRNLAPPGPTPWPVLGDLHLLGKHPNPFVAFTALSKIYGDIFGLTLGSVRCVVVNNFSLIKEVLISKGSHFGGRPDFIRFHKLFGGDRNNCKSYFHSYIVVVGLHLTALSSRFGYKPLYISIVYYLEHTQSIQIKKTERFSLLRLKFVIMRSVKVQFNPYCIIKLCCSSQFYLNV